MLRLSTFTAPDTDHCWHTIHSDRSQNTAVSYVFIGYEVKMLSYWAFGQLITRMTYSYSLHDTAVATELNCGMIRIQTISIKITPHSEITSPDWILFRGAKYFQHNYRSVLLEIQHRVKFHVYHAGKSQIRVRFTTYTIPVDPQCQLM
jgi:hypothetical protein